MASTRSPCCRRADSSPPFPEPSSRSVPARPNFGRTHSILRGTRPLHITAVPDGTIYWGEYFDNSARDEVHIYASTDAGATWSVAYTFPKGAIRHIHNIVHDPWGDCLWVLTGDYGDECRILRAACDFSRVEAVLQGQQQTRAVAAIPTEDGLYFSSDTPLEHNYIYRLDRQESLLQVAPISSSSIYGCRVGSRVFFSTMVEPSEVNRDRHVRLYGGTGGSAQDWHLLRAWQKDRWPMGLFQYGNAFLPDGNNTHAIPGLDHDRRRIRRHGHIALLCSSVSQNVAYRLGGDSRLRLSVERSSTASSLLLSSRIAVI